VCGLTDPGAVCIPCGKDTDCDHAGRCAGLACQSGTCITVQPPLCSDDNPGTLDQCILDDAGAPQCVHTCLNDGGCRDGNPCHTATCVGGACIPGPAPTCDDGDPCTDDACVPGIGCVSTPASGFASVTCTCGRDLPAACAGLSVPPSIGGRHQRACGLVGAAASTARRPLVVRRLRKAVQTLAGSIHAVASARRRALSADCTAALTADLRDARDRAARLLTTLAKR
jgi:hypothetical protein